jgi:RNAse (barnase) inhibitor barstar
MRKTIPDAIWDVLNKNKLQPDEAIWVTLVAIKSYVHNDKRVEECLVKLLRGWGYHVEQKH